ncbi:transketolase [Gammaproteobacteria bacterium]|nr:transketolase [Gammaproteobacteria bacterium]
MVAEFMLGENSYSPEEHARRLRRSILDMALEAGSSSAHIGGALSIVDVTAVLFGQIMRVNLKNPEWPDRDRYILSKGHACLAYYAALHDIGYISDRDRLSFEKTGSRLLGHPVMDRSIGIEFTNGSLGMGLGLGIGVALAGKKRHKNYRVFVVMGDGECNEGSVWEAAMAASHFKLGNLVVIIDRNRYQQTGSNSTVMDLGNLERKWRSFGWDCEEIDGHNYNEIYEALNKNRSKYRPVILIANTVKGKGVSFAEGDNAWHHSVLTKKMYDVAIGELK